ncbi:MAG: hypothetical protein AAFY35_12095 [Pseudomonadota bacterium]
MQLQALKTSLVKKPANAEAHLMALQQAYLAGDIIAVFQAFDYCCEQGLPLPTWAQRPYEQTLIGTLQRKSGTLGKGNSAFGNLRKMFVRSVRASAYLYVRAWQKDPRGFYNLPSGTLKKWLENEYYWQHHKKADDAARLAGDGLKGTGFQAQSSTIRRSANRFPQPIPWGRHEAEAKLGLRNANGVFAQLPPRLPHHAQQLLEKWDAK